MFLHAGHSRCFRPFSSTSSGWTKPWNHTSSKSVLLAGRITFLIWSMRVRLESWKQAQEGKSGNVSALAGRRGLPSMCSLVAAPLHYRLPIRWPKSRNEAGIPYPWDLVWSDKFQIYFNHFFLNCKFWMNSWSIFVYLLFYNDWICRSWTTGGTPLNYHIRKIKW